ncbi:MAG: Flp pilus assembly complex ATPase component TadA, partial [Bdellovibrionales bacterium]|nr:Flp pilus assembly complex ATPase component TadA [Bdellovibrionales bacterium]
MMQGLEPSPGRIGELLLKYTSLSQEQLEECVKIQEGEGGRLGDILLRKKYVLPHEIQRALCAQMDLPWLDDLRPQEIDPKLVEKIPINYARQREVLPVSFQDGVLQVVIADPFNLEALEDLRVLYQCPDIRVAVTSSMRMQDAINRVYERVTTGMIQEIEGEEEEYDLEGPIDILDATEDEAPVIRFVNSVLFRAVKEKASDIHIEPFEKEMAIRFRIDGVMHDILRQPKKVHAAISSRIKIMGNLDIAEKRLPQDGRIKI